MKKKCFGILFVLSGMILSCLLIVKSHYNYINIIVTSLVSVFTYAYIYVKTFHKNLENIKENTIFSLICIVLVYFVMLHLYITKAVECKELLRNYIINFYDLKIYILSSLSAVYMGIYILNIIRNWLIGFFKSLDSWDKKAYIISSFICATIIIIAFFNNSNWFLQYDKIYSIDSGWCFSNILPKSTYYDIRHPLINFFAFPVWSVLYTAVFLILPKNIHTVAIAIFAQIINSQLLILTGLLLKQLTKKRFMFVLYMFSFPVMLFLLFFEKYQLCTFLAVLYVYTLCERKGNSIPSLISGAGVMPTSCILGICEFLTSDSPKIIIKKVLKILFVTILVFICLGRAHIFVSGFLEMQEQKATFSQQNFTARENLVVTGKMFKSCFIALPSSQSNNNTYLWNSLQDKVSIVSLLIILLMIIGFINNRNDCFSNICAIWVIFAICLFAILKWSSHEAPLFSIYFSWAVLPLTLNGIDCIIKKFRLNKKYIYSLLLIVISIINISRMIDINLFIHIL